MNNTIYNLTIQKCRVNEDKYKFLWYFHRIVTVLAGSNHMDNTKGIYIE